MSNLEKTISIPPDAIKIYKLISKNKKISIVELEKQTKLDRGKLEYFLSYLDKENLIERSTVINQIFVLTQEGKDAVEQIVIVQLLLNTKDFHMPIHNAR